MTDRQSCLDTRNRRATMGGGMEYLVARPRPGAPATPASDTQACACGKQNRARDRFCTACGQSLTGSRSTASGSLAERRRQLELLKLAD